MSRQRNKPQQPPRGAAADANGRADTHNAPREVANVERAAEERAGRSASFALLAQLVGGVLTATLTIFLGRALSAGQYGAFAFSLSVVAIATLFVDAGITASTSRFLAERRDRPSAAAAVFRTALRLKLLVGLPGTVALFVLAGPICNVFGTSNAAWALRAGAIALLAQTMFDTLLSAFIALGKVRYNLALATLESVAEVGVTVPLVIIGGAASSAMFGRAIGFTAGLLAGLVLAGRTIGRLRARARRQELDEAGVSPRQILGYAGPLMLVDAAFRVFVNIDVLLIAALVGGGAYVAAFGLVLRLTFFLEYPCAAVASAVAPRLARGSRNDVLLFAESVRLCMILQVLLVAPLLIWPEAIMHLIFGDKYPEAPSVLRAIAPYVLLSGIAQLTTLAVNYLGEAWRRVPIAFAMLALNVGIDIVLLPSIGIVGGAIGSSAAYALWVPAHVWILWRRGSLPLRPLLLTTARSCVAGAVMVGVLALLGTGRVPIPLMLVGAVVGPAVYIAALVALRELGHEDVLLMRRLVTRRAPA